MRVLCVIDDLGSGGAQRQLVNVAAGLARRGHGVELFTYHADSYFRPEVERAGIPIHAHEKSGRFSLAPVHALRALIRRGRFDAVLAFLETPAVYAELAALGTGVRLVVGERSSVYGGRVSSSRRLKSHLHRLADLVVTNSQAHRIWLADRFPFLRGRLETVWNGIDLDRFARPAGFVRTGAPAELRLLGIGRVTRAKNMPRLVEAIARARAAGVSLRVDWVGRDDDAAEAAETRRRIEELRVGDVWHWLGERQDIPALCWSADALIAPSLWEGLPNVVCEALASGLPVLASNVSDNPRLVQDGERGFIFPAEDVAAIADAIGRFAILPAAVRATMGERARRFAEEQLGFEACISAYERLLSPTASRA